MKISKRIFLLSYFYLIKAYIFLRIYKNKNIPKKISVSCSPSKKNINYDLLKYSFEKASIFHFLNVECFERSLAMYYLLSHLGIPSRLCVGINKKELMGHAWIESNVIKEVDENYWRKKFSVLFSVGGFDEEQK
ncbi:lasso peptide biosynthesis B2 protein [Clostridium sp.]|uniref:lasso peptide biosynthesis B2 protein n=1 Tax=Clostridium sp. TaxID=1506 RepID=UPI003F40B32E